MSLLAHSNTLTPHMVNGVGYYTFPAFDAFSFVRHGFSTRIGGVSEGIYQSMNLSFTRGDKEDHVRENFERFCAAVGVDSKGAVVPVTLIQLYECCVSGVNELKDKD